MDFITIHAYARQPKVVQFMVWGPNTTTDTLIFLNKVRKEQWETPRKNYELAIELKSNGKHIGGCGLYIEGKHSNTANLGYILHPDYWNKGYITETVIALLNFGKDVLKIKNLYATCNAQNIPSQKVLEKTGFAKTASIEKDFKHNGEWRTTLRYDHIEEDKRVNRNA